MLRRQREVSMRTEVISSLSSVASAAVAKVSAKAMTPRGFR